MNVTKNENYSVYGLASLLLAILFCTYLRISLLIIYPFLAIFVFYLFNWKLDKNAAYIFGWILLCWLLSFRNGFYIEYNLVSFYYFLPFFLLLFAIPQKSRLKDIPARNYLGIFMRALAIIAIINDIPGIYQYLTNKYDDSFVGIYGHFTVSQNGLSIVNAVLFFYHFTIYQFTKKKIHILYFSFFIFCCVLGFYGAGQLALIAAIILTFLKIRKKNLLQLVVFSILTLAAVIILMKIVSPLTLDYNVNIIKMFLKPTDSHAPRKIIIFLNYLKAYPSDIVDLLFGSGPGTFNSRTAFMVGSPTYFNVELIKSSVQPFYFQHYAYTLWNPTNTGPYDGFMNQPFTSILALLGEYGLILVLVTGIIIGKRFFRFNSLNARMAKENGISIEANMYRFCSIYLLLLIIIDNYIEYPEVLALILLIIKLSEQKMRNTYFK